MLDSTRIVLVGSPNVGKSVIFNYLTGAYVTVSNYPGTTVDVAKGRSRCLGSNVEVVDTPGVYSLIPLTDEERVTRELLENEKADIVIHVVDAKNLRRMLPLTLQLLEAGLPVLLTINLMDEAQARGIRIHIRRLADILGIPVVATSAVKRKGLDDLKRAVALYKHKCWEPFRYSPLIENCIQDILSEIDDGGQFSKRALALLLLQGDQFVIRRMNSQSNAGSVFNTVYRCLERFGEDPEYIISKERQEIVDTILAPVLKSRHKHSQTFADTLGWLTREPMTGIPILCLVLYWGLYQFVGRFGAGFLVDYIDKVLFARYITPGVEMLIQNCLPWAWLQSLFIGDYGLFSLGVRYAIVIVLPIVGTFFLMFAILEDCGYLPRLAMLVDQLFKKFGLNGRAVIPVTLGLGCGTMAVMVTRTLESKRERLLATFLLSLAIPCSAQLGVVLALLSVNETNLAIWAVYMLLIFIAAGWIAARVIPGKRSAFYMEFPPLRLPILSNILKKAYTRMLLYFSEILPIFIFTSFLLWLGNRFGFLSMVLHGLAPVMKALGLPLEAADVFLLGFFRRDYGAAGLYDMAAQGLLNDRQVLVAATTLTLFVPCVAQFMVMVKERGAFVSLIIVSLIIFIALGSGIAMNRLLSVFM